MKQVGKIADFDYEKDKIYYHITHHYKTDFRLVGKYGRVMYIETKGFFKSKDRTKHKKIKEQHPEYDIRFIFMNSTARLSKKSKTTYGEWCVKNGFKYSNKRIPEEWLMELNKPKQKC